MSGSHMVSSPRISQRFVTYVPTSNSHAAGNFRTPPRVKPVVRGRFFRRTTLTAKRAKALAPCDWTISSMDFSGSGTGLLACNMPGIYTYVYIATWVLTYQNQEKIHWYLCVASSYSWTKKSSFLTRVQVMKKSVFQEPMKLHQSFSVPDSSRNFNKKKCPLKKWCVRLKWPTVGG